MTVAVISILALAVIVILGSIRNDLNIGIFALAFAYLIGFFLKGMSSSEVSVLFPSDLFLMLVGITLMSYISLLNGTLEKIAGLVILISKGKPQLMPLIIFGSAFFLSALGAGNIAATALVAPFAITLASKERLNIMLIIIMICTGANAGTFSPVATTGIINIGLMSKIGIDPDLMTTKIFLYAAFIQSLTAAAAYFIFKGYSSGKNKKSPDSIGDKYDLLNSKQWITLFAAVMLFAAVLFFHIPVGLASFTLASILFLLKIAPTEKVIREIPWGVILLVTGITVLIGMIERSGGMDLAATFIASNSSLTYINGLLAFVSGIFSVFSSSSGVVMPAIISLLPDLISKFGGGDISKMIIAVDVGSHMVDVSPLSILGAICLSVLPAGESKSVIFRKLLLWGLSMSFVGALLSLILLDRFFL
ncbi:MAG: SLC13 family permease [Ignavibacteria bacterium]